jgi:HCOMODA/2-hydroxy-3-carboxy-muconic semialdehyde decarboxylase
MTQIHPRTFDDRSQEQVQIAARALARAGLVRAYGHCSLRLDADRFLVCAAKPMGLILRNDLGTVVPIDGPLPDGVLGEVRIHQAIYRLRPDVGGIARTTPDNLMTLSTARCTPLPRHGMGAYFAPSVPLWDNTGLVRTDELALSVARAVGQGNAIVLRGNGAVVAAVSLQEAVVLSYYLEDAARVELQLRMAGMIADAPPMTEEQAAQRAVRSGGIIGRMWDYLTADDSEGISNAQ